MYKDVGIGPQLWEEAVAAMHTIQLPISSVHPRLMTVVFSLGKRLHVCMRTNFQNGCLHSFEFTLVNKSHSPHSVATVCCVGLRDLTFRAEITVRT